MSVQALNHFRSSLNFRLAGTQRLDSEQVISGSAEIRLKATECKLRGRLHMTFMQVYALRQPCVGDV